MNYPMKYTICGFNQQKLFEYSLDINDAQILRWLIDFAATGKMRKLIENNTVYYRNMSIKLSHKNKIY